MTNTQRIEQLETQVKELSAKIGSLDSLVKVMITRDEALTARIEELSKAKAALKNIRPAYQAPGTAERRARMQAEIDFRHGWCPKHPGFTKEQLEAAMAEHFAPKAA